MRSVGCPLRGAPRFGSNLPSIHVREACAVSISGRMTPQAQLTSPDVSPSGSPCAFSDPAFCEDAVAATRRELGAIDILVNNAAFQEHVPDFEWSDDLEANAAVVQGATEGYADAGYDVGIYSTPILWRGPDGKECGLLPTRVTVTTGPLPTSSSTSATCSATPIPTSVGVFDRCAPARAPS